MPENSNAALDAVMAALRQLVASFHDESVHGGFEKAFADIPPALRGANPERQPFTLWRLLEHLRLCVFDFLDYCRTPDYQEPIFPEGYWPETDAPPSDAAWDDSVNGYLESVRQFENLILNSSTDLFSVLPGTAGRLVLRQVLACLDHNGYHLGQVFLLRRLLGIWS